MKFSLNPQAPPRHDFFHQPPAERMNGIFIGVVKRLDDGQTMGRISVWIPEFGGDPNDNSSWITVSYAPPFAGVTDPNALVQNSTVLAGTQKSYGWWMIPPDLENQVLCCFVNGNAARGFWFACIYQQNMNNMVPGLPSGATTEPAGQQLRAGSLPPVAEYNKWSDVNPNNPQRAVYSPLDAGLSQQGLYPDPERGPSTSGARREAPSKVFGFLTPDGNQVYVDENAANEFVRLRTKSGVQVLIHETTGYVYINSKQGNSWIEVSDKGVDIYSLGTVSLRSEGSMNLKADGSLNIEAVGNLNLRAGGNLTIQSAHQTDIAGNGRLTLQFGGVMSAKVGGDLLLDSSGNLRMGSGGDTTMASGGNNIRSAANIYDNTSPSAPSPGAPAAQVAQPAVLPDVNGVGPAYTAIQANTIVQRMPTHEPYVNHPKGLDINPAHLTSSDFASSADSQSVNNAIANSGAIVASPDLTNLPQGELDWLACCMIDEAANQGQDGLAAVAQVIKNRMACHYSSDGTIKGTVLYPNQFSGFYYATVGGRYQKVCSDISCATQRGLQKMATYQKQSNWSSTRALGEQVMGGTYNGGSGYQAVKANKRCVLYLNVSATQKLSGHIPTWADSSNLVAQINAHNFYLS